MKKILLFLTIVLLPALAFSQLKITSGTGFTTTGNVHIVLADMDFLNNGTLDATGSTLKFSGANNSNILGNSIYLQNITVDKPVGKQLNLLGTLYVNGQVNFISGNIELNDKEILLGGTGSLVGESETSRATSNNYGFINAHSVLNAPDAVNLANLGLVITSPVNLGLVSITRNFDSQDLPSGGKGIKRNFDIFPTVNANLNATITIKYFDAELNGLNENSLTQFHRDGYLIYSNRSFSARDAATNYVTQTGYDNLYRLTLGTPVITLPVKLVDFTAGCKGNFIQLSWKTASEQNSDRFDVQRSRDGTIWEKVGAVKAAGSSTLMQSYQYNDNTLAAATAFYRLAQYDKDGNVTYSTIVKAGCGGSTEFKVMPNPVSSVAKVVIGSRGANTGTLQLINAGGQQVYRQAVTLNAGINQYEINTTGLPGGVYNLILTPEGMPVQTARLVKQ